MENRRKNMSSMSNIESQTADTGTSPVRLPDAGGIDKLVSAITDQILAEYGSPEAGSFILVGIHRNGVPLAKRIASEIAKRTGKTPETSPERGGLAHLCCTSTQNCCKLPPLYSGSSAGTPRQCKRIEQSCQAGT